MSPILSIQSQRTALKGLSRNMNCTATGNWLLNIGVHYIELIWTSKPTIVSIPRVFSLTVTYSQFQKWRFLDLIYSMETPIIVSIKPEICAPKAFLFSSSISTFLFLSDPCIPPPSLYPYPMGVLKCSFFFNSFFPSGIRIN